MFGYIYETTNLINGKKYIGKKISNKFLGNLYLGSGVALREAISKYGKNNFEVKLLEEVDGDKETLSEKEKYWIKYYDAQNSREYYNMTKGGDGSDGFRGKHFSEETMNRLREINKKRSDKWAQQHKGKSNIEIFGEERAKEISKKLSDANKRYYANKRKEKLQQWLDEKHTCENCGKVMTEYYGSGRFCSLQCSRHTKPEINYFNIDYDDTYIYKCDNCGRRFNNKGAYKLHIRYKHQ